MDADAVTVLIFAVASLVIAAGMTGLALGPLRDRREERHGVDDGLVAPLAADASSRPGATDELSGSPPGVRDELSGEPGAERTRGARADESASS
jgi:hypothetical protein